MLHKEISPKKQALIDDKNNSPFSIGERISVFEKAVSKYTKGADKKCTCTISSLDDGITVFIGSEASKHPELHKITKEDIASRELYYIGVNPFEEEKHQIRPVAFTLDSILFNLDVLGEKTNKYKIEDVDIENLNWNPFVYGKNGKKQYYQRPFVWSTEDKQLLVESIYHNIDCGKILVRKRGWEELRKMEKAGEKELSWHDIVDGKQRLSAVSGFIKGEFSDLEGNFFSDLSASAQHHFSNHQLFSYAEMPEGTKDADVLKQFLKLNFCGVPQSKEHIIFVKSLQNKI